MAQVGCHWRWRNGPQAIIERKERRSRGQGSVELLGEVYLVDIATRNVVLRSPDPRYKLPARKVTLPLRDYFFWMQRRGPEVIT